MGKVYSENGNKYDQENRLLIATTGLQNEEHWFNGKLERVFQLKGIIESVFKSLEYIMKQKCLQKTIYGRKGIVDKKGNINWQQ